ncbi:hypothetical protein, partial [Klebsiella pneumoniae]|uniref:hypothetical protein n=1 Tax=Klebsiella pneumoniae TaxID=573 RepID=UPI001AEF5357
PFPPPPQSARLLPRLACALNMPLFVRFVQAAKALSALALKAKNDVSKIVQICALLCNSEKYKLLIQTLYEAIFIKRNQNM